MCHISFCFLSPLSSDHHLTYSIFYAIFPPVRILCSFHCCCCVFSRYAANVDAKEGKDWKELNKEGKEVESSRPVSVLSSLSYRKRSALDPGGGKSDLLTALQEDVLPQDGYSSVSRRTSHTVDQGDGRESVISQAYSEASSRARKGLDSRWGDLDKESTLSFPAPSQASTRPRLSPEDEAQSSTSLGQGRRSLYGSSPSSPCFSRRSEARSPGSLSRAESRFSLAASCRLSELDVDLDDSRSVAFTERSAYSPHSSSGRSLSMPPPRSRSALDDEPPDSLDIKTVSHRNYLDPDLEKAINEVLSFKPIKFKRSTLEDSDGQAENSQKQGDDSKGSRSGDGARPTNTLRRSTSALDCRRDASSCSGHIRSKSRGKGKKKSSTSESHSSENDRHHRSSSKRRHKKSKRKSKKKKVDNLMMKYLYRPDSD